MGSLPSSAGVTAVTVDPTHPERVYVTAPTGVFRSDDAGQSWGPANGGLEGVEIVALSVDPVMTDRVFAGAQDGRIFGSDDGGATWQRWGK